MPQSSLDRVLRSALYVDFDNIYIGLRKLDERASQSFATQPQSWLAWLEGSLPLHGVSDPGVRRRIQVRRCYLNPRDFGSYRPYLMRAAFETVDCPPLTVQGKTSADVHMVLDMLELLDHDVFYDEFIIMSGDADFTPVLLKLRKCDRRTSILGIGPASAAYKAASDQVIDQDVFLTEALGAGQELEVARPERPPAGAHLPGELRRQCSLIVKELVAKATSPVPLAALAQGVRQACPAACADWAGYGAFKSFLAKLDLGGLKTAEVAPGYLYDPERHEVPAGPLERHAELSRLHPQLAEVTRKVTQLTDTPCLLPEHYAKLFEVIASHVNEEGFQLASVSRSVRDKLKGMGVSVSRQQINFVLRGITFAGHRFGETREVPSCLAQKMLENTLTLCENAQLTLTEEEKRLLQFWLGA